MNIGVNKRISILIDRLNLNPNSFAESLKTPGATIYNMVTGRKSKPSYEILEKIKSRYPEIDLNWLVIGEGDSPFMKESPTTREDVTLLTTKSSTLKNIPVISLRAAANALRGIEASEPLDAMDTISLPGWMIHPGTHIALQVKGLSMHPVISDGSVVVVRRVEKDEWSTISNGRIYLVYSETYGCQIKYLKRSDRNPSLIILESENAEENPSFSLHVEDVHQIWELELNLNFKFISQRKQILDRVSLLEAAFHDLYFEFEKMKTKQLR